MNTGNRNPLQLPEDKTYTTLTSAPIIGKLVKDANNKFLFPPLNTSNSFATVDYDTHINTKIDFTINHVLKTMTASEH